MKNITKKQKIITLIIALVVLAGVIVTFTIGLNYTLKYKEAKRINLYLDKAFEISDIKEIVKEVMPNKKVLVQKVEIYEDSVSIIAEDITEEQKQGLVEKINEKYEKEFDANSIEMDTVPSTNGIDLIMPYLLPFGIATIVIMAYMSLRYRKLNWLGVALKSIAVIVIAEVVLLSVIAITRIPVCDATIPLAIAVYVLSCLGLTNKFEKELTKISDK